MAKAIVNTAFGRRFDLSTTSVIINLQQMQTKIRMKGILRKANLTK